MSDFTNDIDGYDLDDCDWIEDNFDIESWTKNTYDKAVFIKEMDESYLINCINKLKKDYRKKGNDKRVLYILIMENELLKRRIDNLCKKLEGDK